jgi:hypothetical protein
MTISQERVQDFLDALVPPWQKAIEKHYLERKPVDAQQGEGISAFQALKSALQGDQDYAWSWHCSLAMPIMDSIKVSHAQANEAGAHLMKYLFDIDVTTFPEWYAAAQQGEGK